MCGIAGVIGNPSPSEEVLCRMRDAMLHRGPDDHGCWLGEGVALAHRRLAVRDPGPLGRQPMISADGRFVLAYNGEIYNDSELRGSLGGRWQTTCDTETLLRWLSADRPVSRVRGMYAFAFVDTTARRLVLARDPLGIKPLFWTRFPGGVAFASEIQALFEHPLISPEPSPLGVSLYLSSVRTAMGGHTLFRGVFALQPGESLTFNLDDPALAPRSERLEIEPAGDAPTTDDLAEAVCSSVLLHTPSDVGLCSLLSGGLDSTIIASVVRPQVTELRTYCAGARGETGDPQFARQAAAWLGTTHTTSLLDETSFSDLWLDTVSRTGLPLATPNQVAIRMIARSLRADGQVVTLSGEGADELFAGYDGPLVSASQRSGVSGGRFELESNSWVPMDIKPLLLSAELARSTGDDAELVALFESEFDACGASEGVEAHLRFHRRVNLPVLLERLDSATMLEGVEGRTPFADAMVAGCAAAIPIGRLFDPRGATPAERTKLALRRAFADRLPAEIVARPKASFPVPFDRWMEAGVGVARRSRVAAQLFEPAVLAPLFDDPRSHWNLAWPVLNLVLWAERWWGRGIDQLTAASTRGTAESSRFV